MDRRPMAVAVGVADSRQGRYLAFDHMLALGSVKAERDLLMATPVCRSKPGHGDPGSARQYGTTLALATCVRLCAVRATKGAVKLR